jgi:8-oxo-dGTP pyrophosphatase MutT (NUDIX family)
VQKEEEMTMEMWDIYDENKRPTGRTMKRNDWNMKEGEYHLTVLGVIAHSDGRFLITKRVMTKAWAPGHWEVSGGAVQAGETSKEAVLREVREETGLDVSNWEGGYVFSYKRVNPEEKDNYFVDIYRFVSDFSETDIKLQTEETDGYMLATKEEIKKLGEEGVFLHYNSIKEVFGIL